MELHFSRDNRDAGREAASFGAACVRAALEQHGEAAIVLATGVSQLQMLGHLAPAPEIRWDRVTAFHLDEYIGLPITHPASFRLFLWQRFTSRLPLPLKRFISIDGEAANPAAECQRLAARIKETPIDVAFIGIGENGHLAFNDPPADFMTRAAYAVVELDEACRRQQLGEGWFPTLDDVPKTAISMTCPQILKARTIVCTVPEARKAQAVKGAVEGPVTPDLPASLLQTHPNAALYLDADSAALLSPK